MHGSAEKIWGSAQQLLRARLNEEIYHLWFAPLKATSLESEVLTLEVANDFCEVWLQDNYLDLLREALTQASGQPLKIKFHVGTGAPNPKAPHGVEHHKSPIKDSAEAAERSGPMRD